MNSRNQHIRDFESSCYIKRRKRLRKLQIYSISDEYIAFLRKSNKLKQVFENKEGHRVHTRKYLGVVIEKNGFSYFIPFSSPKESDYMAGEDGIKTIRKSIIPIIRMTTKDTLSGELELKGTLKLSNMIPVPDSQLIPYEIYDETDLNYRTVVLKEYQFIKSNKSLIIKSAEYQCKQYITSLQ